LDKWKVSVKRYEQEADGCPKAEVWAQQDGLEALEIVHPDAAGIDVGGSEHWVKVSPDWDPEPVRCFGCFTADLREMAKWLVEKGVRSVAMQSTGVYWMPVLEVLEEHGLEGLLRNSFQPTAEIRTARTLWRHRGNLVGEASSAIQRMQKVLVEMNVQLSNVLSDLSGVSGMNIMGAILQGERDPWKLTSLVEPEVKATQPDIAKSLEGKLASGITVCAGSGSGTVSGLSEEDRGLPPAVAQAASHVGIAH
jgi:transposase